MDEEPQARGARGVRAGLWVLCCMAAMLPWGVARAEGAGGVAESGMGQGEASISVRSDVRMEIEGARGTGRTRLLAIGKEVSPTMAALRGCYAELVEEAPTVQGEVRVGIVLEKKTPELSLERQGDVDRRLVKCVTRAMGGLRFRAVERPAAAVVVLTFDNSGARGHAALRAHREEDAEAAVKVDPDGVPRARWATTDGKLEFRIAGAGKTSPSAVAGVYRALREGFAGLLDCRRRAGRRGMSPAGRLELQAVLRGRKPPAVKVRNSAIEDERAPLCVQRVMRRLRLPPDLGAGRVDVVVQFAN